MIYSYTVQITNIAVNYFLLKFKPPETKVSTSQNVSTSRNTHLCIRPSPLVCILTREWYHLSNGFMLLLRSSSFYAYVLYKWPPVFMYVKWFFDSLFWYNEFTEVGQDSWHFDSIMNPSHYKCFWIIHVQSFIYKHSQKKRKDSLETRAVLLIFSLELEISRVAVQNIHQNSEKWQLLLGTAQ